MTGRDDSPDDPAWSAETADRDLFDRISNHYAKKDVVASTKAARSAIVRRAARPIVAARGGLGTLVDIGCGIGAQCEYLDGTYDRYIGVDYSRELIELGRERYGGRPNVEYLVSNIKDADVADHSADTVLAIGALHHMTGFNEVMTSLRRIAKPGATFIAVEPQRGNSVVQGMRWVRMRIDRHYSSDQHFFSFAEMRELISAGGLRQSRLEYQGFLTPPFAQVGVRPQAIFYPLSKLACALEPAAEKVCFGPLGLLSWNIVAYAEFP